MREKEAMAACEKLTIVKVASKHGKADISKYRDAGAEVAKVFLNFTELLERASVDEGKKIKFYKNYLITIIICSLSRHNRKCR